MELLVHFLNTLSVNAWGVAFSRKFLIGAIPRALLRGPAKNVIKVSNIALSSLTHGFLFLHKQKNYLGWRGLACSVLSW